MTEKLEGSIAGIDDRLRSVEIVLFGLKAAAAVLGLTSLGLFIYIRSTAGALETARNEAIASVRAEGQAQKDSINVGLEPVFFEGIKGDRSQTQLLGAFPACFLTQATTWNSTQACQCKLEHSRGGWQLVMKATPGRGQCECQAACMKKTE